MPAGRDLRPVEPEVLVHARVRLLVRLPVRLAVDPSAQLTQGGAGRVHGRRGDRVVGRRPVVAAARAGSARMRVPLEAFRFEDDASPGKSKGELFPTVIYWAG